MPEIAEVERARLRIHRQVLGYKINHVDTTEDNLVYPDLDHQSFAESIKNKTLIDTKRWGKYFVLYKGPHIVAHLGMTGGIRFEHEEKDWPPKYWKLLIEFVHPQESSIRFGFKDPRRIARLRLVEDPMKTAPISKLGFDPVLNMPSFEVFRGLVTKRAVPIKVLLLDQSFSAGVGNWVADEILFQSEVHPAQHSNTLTPDELVLLYKKTKYVCDTAVSVEADESKFPGHWLMKYRWKKGKGFGRGVLPDGQVLKFETIGGRTTAFSPARQVLRERIRVKKTEKKVEKKTEKMTETKTEKKTERKTEKTEKMTEKKTEKKIQKIRCSTKYNLRQIQCNH